MTTENKIASALFTHLQTFATGEGLPLVVSGQKGSQPPASGMYLRGTMLPRRTVGNVSLGQKDFGGIFQVDLFVPEDIDPDKAYDVAGRIVLHFAHGLNIPGDGMSVRVTDPATALAARPESGKSMIPVEIPYRSFNQ